MTPGQIANGTASAWVAGMGSMFIVSYAMLARWKDSAEGRLMMALVVAITLTCSLTLTMTVFGFKPNVDWLRFIQAALWGVIGVCFLTLTIKVWKTQVIRRKRFLDDDEGIYVHEELK